GGATSLASTLTYSAEIHKTKMDDTGLTNIVAGGSVVEHNLDLGLWIKDKQDREEDLHVARRRLGVNNFIIRLKGHGWKVNHEDWQIDTTNTISFGERGVHASNFRLTNNGQDLLVQSQDSSLNAPIDVSFDNFRIETFTQMLESEMLDLGGGIN